MGNSTKGNEMNANALTLRMLSTALLFSMLGCGADVIDGESVETDGPIDSTTEALSGPTTFFESYTYLQSNGGAQVERYADCAPDQVLSGVGARVVSDNVTDLTVYCRDILANGTLSVNESQFTAGGASQEKQLHATNAHAVVGFGAIVSGDNVNRIVLRICPWIAATKRVDVLNCSFISTTVGSNSAEQAVDTHGGLSAALKPRTVATGAGFTTSSDNVFAVRMSSGLLK
jgi:hypothetical protein